MCEVGVESRKKSVLLKRKRYEERQENRGKEPNDCIEVTKAENNRVSNKPELIHRNESPRDSQCG